MKREIYMDYAATTFVKPEVLKEMNPYFTEYFGNPSSVYYISRKTKMAIVKARESVSKTINANKDEIFFTSGGSEADNWAIKGIALANGNKGRHIITTKIEHHAVLNTCGYLEKHGFEISYLPVDKSGRVDLDSLRKAIREDTILVSVMFANNEIGTLEPIEEIGKLCREKGILFHTDAVQAVGNVPIDVQKMNIDLLSMAAHKFYGPKGMGALYIKKGIKIDGLIQGGSQERGRRAGTENIPGIVGMGKALSLASENMNEESKRLTYLRDRLIDGLLKIPGTRLNGYRTNRLPGNVNVTFDSVDGEVLVMALDDIGIYASTGSACSAGSIEPSHVLTAIGLSDKNAKSSLRLTLGAKTTEEDVDYAVSSLNEIISKLRENNKKWSERID
ncbi:cysteine desulfurase NifS [Clostridium luticellarii]|uniref:Cysteine desulfurase IscS n=1 Tax=Clostridium luticellarii TaxID=1691940 RepID=A0A2T0BG08_9CLOT|nr:cysteine desulfurase NifS [Clostridium luticellarii]MCI1968509.1 cysteine desulfurase NifS [Clostridium luticellarii]MCI1995962.1 cysteine desulfurase NifS [Clostridium luticellarii]MCI2040461.1 cysteine desulfurase NifS [Clostridium luticellarii]PRR82767.1 Cysteine desulfurase [Clostridium luticellarii]